MTKQMPSFCSRNEMCSSMWIELGKVLSSTPVLSCLSHKTSSQSISVTRFGLDKEECWQLFFPRFATKKGLIMRDTLALLKLYSSATLHDGFSLNDFPSDLFTCTHMRGTVDQSFQQSFQIRYQIDYWEPEIGKRRTCDQYRRIRDQLCPQIVQKRVQSYKKR